MKIPFISSSTEEIVEEALTDQELVAVTGGGGCSRHWEHDECDDDDWDDDDDDWDDDDDDCGGRRWHGHRGRWHGHRGRW
jgi:hypothetical protein